jgi:hypothetical protein
VQLAQEFLPEIKSLLTIHKWLVETVKLVQKWIMGML